MLFRSLTRVEMDAKAHGALVAQCILEQLTGQPNGHGPVELAPTFIVGETTRGRSLISEMHGETDNGRGEAMKHRMQANEGARC